MSNSLCVRIKRFDKTLPLPAYQTAGAAAFDLTARQTVTIPAQSVGYIPLNVAVATPHGHFLLLAARSSTHKKGLLMANGIGIGDPDFRGDGDEYHAALLNISRKTVKVERGERIAQGIFVKLAKAKWQETERMGQPTRGGFGSTGKK